MDRITNLLQEIDLEEIEDDCCIICQDIITNEFGILNCDCKTLYFHNNCLNTWLKKCNKCPQCSKKFNSKPSKFNKPTNFYNKLIINNHQEPIVDNHQEKLCVYAINYNILRIMSGMSGLAYSS